MSNIYEISNKIRNIYEELASGIGVDEETGEICPEILQALSFTQNELQEKVVDYGFVIKSFEDEIDIYSKEIDRLQKRKKQLENTQKQLKQVITNAMIEFDVAEIKGKTIRVKLRESEAVQVDNPELLTNEFKRTKITIEPDKMAIKSAIKSGQVVEGACLVKNKNLQIN